MAQILCGDFNLDMSRQNNNADFLNFTKCEKKHYESQQKE